jgi:hypothetical protein
MSGMAYGYLLNALAADRMLMHQSPWGTSVIAPGRARPAPGVRFVDLLPAVAANVRRMVELGRRGLVVRQATG